MSINLGFLLLALRALIPPSVAPRVIYCLIKINTDAEQAPEYKLKMKNALLFVLIAEIATGALEVIRGYLT